MSTKLNYENLDTTVRTDISNLANPTISSVTYTSSGSVVSTQGGDTITVTGTNFLPGAQAYVGFKLAPSVVVVSTTQLTITVPQNLVGTQLLTVINSNGGVAKYATGVLYAPGPYWNTVSGSLGRVYSGATPGFTLSATSDSTISYTVTSGALPAGVTLDSAAGTFVGAAPAVSSDTVYNFTVTATDAEGQTSSRNFAMTVSTDVLYWASPVQSQTLTYTAVGAITQINVAATSKSGNSVSVSVSGLPAGLKYTPSTNAGFSIGSITGVPGVNGTYTVTLVATVANTGVQQTITITIVVNKANGQIVYDTPGTYTWVCPTGVTSISLVLVGGGGGCGGAWGGGGGGGALTYTNNLAVTAGNSYTVTVGAGGDSYSQGGNTWFNTAAYIIANGGKMGVAGNSNTGGGGGGAGGYAGAGGAGAVASTTYAGGAGGTSAGTARTGGFAGGAGGGGRNTNAAVPVPVAPTITFGSGAGGGGAYGQCYGGGGVGLMGAISQSGNPTNQASVVGGDATFGPNGGSPGLLVIGGEDSTSYNGGWPGGGGGGIGSGAGGAVRIIWPGASRTFPATNTMDM